MTCKMLIEAVVFRLDDNGDLLKKVDAAAHEANDFNPVSIKQTIRETMNHF